MKLGTHATHKPREAPQKKEKEKQNSVGVVIYDPIV